MTKQHDTITFKTNTGMTTWGNARDIEDAHSASLLSRGNPSTANENGQRQDDYNETFGTFFILNPMQFGVGVNGPYEPTFYHRPK